MVVKVKWSMPCVENLVTTYTFDGDGRAYLKMTFRNPLFRMPRFGFTMSLAEGYENMVLLGRGPHENYCDRQRAADFGLYVGNEKLSGTTISIRRKTATIPLLNVLPWTAMTNTP